MHKYFIYGLYRDGDIFYIGVTLNINQRLKTHKYKFGKHITIQILDEYYGLEDTALALESFWIKKIRDSGIELENIKCLGEPRKIRAYKCTDDVYFKAMERAKRDGTTLAELVEKWVEMYANDELMVVFPEANSHCSWAKEEWDSEK